MQTWDPRSDPPVVTVTGATSGLGRELVTALHRRGWRVHAHGRDPDRLAGLAADLGGERVRVSVADLSALSQVRALAERVRATEPRLDVLVNNAAVGFGPPGGGRETSRDGHELRFAVNYLAPVLLTRLLLPALRACAPARVVNVGSIGQVPLPVRDAAFTRGYRGVEAYRRSKLALAAHTFDLAEELHGSGVTVNCVHPAGFMDTAMIRESRVTPMSTVLDGLAAVLPLVEDPTLREVTGQFFDGPAPGTAHPDAYDPRFRGELRELTDRLLAPAGG